MLLLLDLGFALKAIGYKEQVFLSRGSLVARQRLLPAAQLGLVLPCLRLHGQSKCALKVLVALQVVKGPDFRPRDLAVKDVLKVRVARLSVDGPFPRSFNSKPGQELRVERFETFVLERGGRE